MSARNCNGVWGQRFLLSSLVVLLLCGAMAEGGVVQGTLCTTEGDSITSDQLRDWINEFIPAGNQRLLVMTQCFGGNAASSFGGEAGTSVVSATSPGETAQYGGYDNDAAGALKPMAGATASDVHTAGTNGKAAGETPSTGGGAAPGGFPLDPVPMMPMMTDPVHSRHVLVYAGIPDGGGGTSDAAQRDTIAMNFAGQPNTSVTSVGGAGGGAGGWTHPGSAAGLRDALKGIGMTIANSPEPTKEQFIMYITDHGDLHDAQSIAAVSPPEPIPVPLTPPESPFETFKPLQLNPGILAGDSDNVPGFSIFLPFQGTRTAPFNPTTPYFPPNCWQLGLDNTSPSGIDLSLPNYSDEFLELNGSGIVGDFPGEGVRVMFRLNPPDNSPQFIDSFFDVFYNVSLTNFTQFTTRVGIYQVTEFRQDSGDIGKSGAPTHPGDFDLDGDVDGADFVAWQTHFPTPLGATLADGDADGDGDVDGADFVIWQTNFPFTPGGGEVAVPEPQSIALLSTALIGLLFWRRRTNS